MRNERCIRIYKYRSLSGAFGREAIERALISSELYWQSPVEFNDPFDCIPVLYFGDNAAQRKAFYARTAAMALEGSPRGVRRQHRQRMNLMPANQMEEQLREAWGEWLAASAVCCFSEVSDHPLMWGHYADSHKGVCLVFDEFADLRGGWFAFPVAYSESRPRVNLTQLNDPDVAVAALCLKSDHWCYEREQRMIGWHEAAGYRKFPQQALKGIILGAKITNQDERFVRDILRRRPDLKVFRTVIDPNDFKLIVTPA